MTITFQVESYKDCMDEVKVHYPAHYEELSVTKTYPLDPDYDAYLQLDQQGFLKVVTCRKDGVLIGYIQFIVTKNLHYKTMVMAVEDIYYLIKEERKGRVGIELFKFAEQYLKSIGVHRICYTTKVHLDNSSIFKYLGYSYIEKLYSKMIG